MLLFITMQPYSDYSFEELRLFAPKVKRYTHVVMDSLVRQEQGQIINMVGLLYASVKVLQ